jgi:hypothetical protein
VPYEININVRTAEKKNPNSLMTLSIGLEIIMNEFMGATVSKVVSLDTLCDCNGIYVFSNRRTRIKKEISAQRILRGFKIKHSMNVLLNRLHHRQENSKGPQQ